MLEIIASVVSGAVFFLFSLICGNFKKHSTFQNNKLKQRRLRRRLGGAGLKIPPRLDEQRRCDQEVKGGVRCCFL